MDSLGGLQALQTLLKPPGQQNDDDNNSSDEDCDAEGRPKKKTSHYAKLNPGDIGVKAATSTTTESSKAIKEADAATAQGNPNDIWHPDEVADGDGAALDSRLVDPRRQPEHEIHFRQAVSPEDMFLGCGNKTPATASCEQIVVTIKLPGTKSAGELNLDVRPKFLDLRSAKYRLGLHLPHPVDPDSGVAKFDCDSQTLTVTLTNKRDFDFVNF